MSNVSLLNRYELADMLGVSVRTIDTELKRGLPHLKIGKSIRFEPDVVLAYFRNKK